MSDPKVIVSGMNCTTKNKKRSQIQYLYNVNKDLSDKAPSRYFSLLSSSTFFLLCMKQEKFQICNTVIFMKYERLCKTHPFSFASYLGIQMQFLG